MRNNTRNNFSLSAFFCLFIGVSLVSSLSFQVEPKTKECFSEAFPVHRNIKLNWQVVRGGLLDINVQIRYDGVEKRPLRQPSIIYEKLHFEKDHVPGNYEMIIKNEGIYTICFDNTMSRFTAKVVQFDTFVHNKWAAPGVDDDDDTSSEIFEPMEKSSKKIGEFLEELKVHQRYMRNRVIAHAETQKSTNSRIFYMSIVESVILLTISFFQVYYIKRFFNKNNRII